MIGTICFMFRNEGSKSEGMNPFLYAGEGEFIPVRMMDENPFENNTLRSFDGKKVFIDGEYNDNEIFMIGEIRESGAEDESVPTPLTADEE